MLVRASNFHRAMFCAMGATSHASRPEDDGDAAREGTCAAWVGELVINGEMPTCQDMLGDVHENGWVVDQEMIDHIQNYVDIVRQYHSVRAEVTMFLPYGNLQLRGTSDTIGQSEKGLLYITDLKYGYGIVEARMNWQLLFYLWLYVATTGHQPEMVQLAIYQPRAQHRDGPYRKWVIGRDEYLPLLQRISERVGYLNNMTGEAVPAPYCKDCTNAVGCEALERTVYEMMQDVQSSRVYREPTPEQLSQEFETLNLMKSLFEARHSAVKAEVEARIDEGGFVPNWAVEDKYGNRMFTVNDVAIQMITGVDPTLKKICTPAELIRRGADKAVVQTITRNPRIGRKLVRRNTDDVAAQFAAAKPEGVSNV